MYIIKYKDIDNDRNRVFYGFRSEVLDKLIKLETKRNKITGKKCYEVNDICKVTVSVNSLLCRYRSKKYFQKHY